MTAKLLTVVVPSYNSADYLHRCLDSLVPGPADTEVVVVDDGSRDATAQIARGYAERFPDIVRVVSKPNGGHGSAINAGLAVAQGRYIKVVDSDDWVDRGAYASLLDMLRERAERGEDDLDVVVSNFVYEKDGRRTKRAVRYRDVLPVGEVFDWDDVEAFGVSQYILMHSLVYRTGLLVECGLVLPEHTFYVDNLYAYVPLADVRTMYYHDVDLYRYYIGRADQSVNESVMISRLDQQLRVNRMMLTHLQEVRSRDDVSKGLVRYLVHYAKIVSAVSSVLLARAGTPAALEERDRFWREVRETDPWLYSRLRSRSVMGQVANLPGRPGRGLSVLAYLVAQRAVGFN